MNALLVGMILWVISAACVALLAYLAHQLVRTNEASLNLASYLFVAVGLVTAIQFGLGILGLLIPSAVAVVCLGLVGAVFVIPDTRRLLFGLPETARTAGVSAQRWWFSLSKILRVLTGILSFTLAARFAFLVVALPPFVWDALTYQLTNVAAWTQAGRLVIIDSPVARMYLPANAEVFTTWFTVFLHHDIVVEAAGIPGYLIACVSVYTLARRLGCGGPAALAASLAYSTTPGLLLAVTAGKNDPLMSGIILLMMAMVVDLVLRDDFSLRRNSVGQLALLLALGLYGLGTKAYLMHVSVGILAVAWALPRATGRKDAWRLVMAASIEQLRKSSWRKAAALAGLLAASLILGAYWYGRNFVLTGNPFYPMGVDVGTTTVIAGVHDNIPISLARLAENLASFWVKFGDRSGPIVPDLPNTTGWGWIAYGVGVPTMIWALIRLRAMRIVVLGFVVSLAVLFLSARASPWNMRYATWFPAMLCLTSACFLQALSSDWRLERWALGLLMVVGGVLNVLPTFIYGRMPLAVFERMLAKPPLERSAAGLYTNIGDTYEFAVATVPDDEVLGYHVEGNGFIYPLFGAGYTQRIAYIPFEWTESCGAIAEAVRSSGTRWLFIGYDDWHYGSRLFHCSLEGHFLNHGEDLYEVIDPASAAG